MLHHAKIYYQALFYGRHNKQALSNSQSNHISFLSNYFNNISNLRVGLPQVFERTHFRYSLIVFKNPVRLLSENRNFKESIDRQFVPWTLC